MRRKVILVDDHREILLSLQEGLGRYKEIFSVIAAGDVKSAINVLRKDDISLVVTDLKMPHTDGFGLLAHVMEFYPDIPVIVMTGYSNAEMERLAHEGGAVGYISKPFKTAELAGIIVTSLRREADGGTLHSVSSGMFLQLIEMEQKTCTIRLEDKVSGKRGVLFFRDGDILDARVNGLNGQEAAHRIFGWEEVNLSIQNSCACRKKRIEGELQAILLEAMRLKDEEGKRKKDPERETEKAIPPSVPEQSEEAGSDEMDILKQHIRRELGRRCGIEEIYRDNVWDGLLGQMGRIGRFFKFGPLRLAYMDLGESKDFVLLPEKKTILIPVNSKCPRDRLVQVLLK
jgi:CheY-like chemotaxis protein